MFVGRLWLCVRASMWLSLPLACRISVFSILLLPVIDETQYVQYVHYVQRVMRCEAPLGVLGIRDIWRKNVGVRDTERKN